MWGWLTGLDFAVIAAILGAIAAAVWFFFFR